MKKTILLLFCIISISVITKAQVDDDLIVLQNLMDQQNYDEIIKYKAKRVKKLSSKSLFYKGLAYFSKQDDKNAYTFFDLAIEKGPAENGMYFYRGFSLYYMEKYNMALKDFKYLTDQNPSESITYSLAGETFSRLGKADSAIFYFKKAIEMTDCNPQTFISLASIYQEKEKYEDALATFKLALLKMKPHEELYKICIYNIGLIQQLMENYAEAQKTFENYTQLYRDDFQAISKLIQVYHQINEAEKSKIYKDILYKAFSDKQLPKQMQTMFCFDQFKWNDRKVLAFEYFDEYGEKVFVCKHCFFILDKHGNVEFNIRSEKDTLGNQNLNDSIYMLKMIKNDSISIYQNYLYRSDFEYSKLKNAVLDILNFKVEPFVKSGSYSKIISSKRALLNKLIMPEKDGSSFEKSIIVESIPEEYEWLGKYYPGYKFIQQSLVFDKKNPFDVVEIKTIDGETVKIYFDISKFFGKGF